MGQRVPATPGGWELLGSVVVSTVASSRAPRRRIAEGIVAEDDGAATALQGTVDCASVLSDAVAVPAVRSELVVA